MNPHLHELIRSETQTETLKPMTQTVNVTELFNIPDLHYIRRTIAPDSLYQYGYILLDTHNIAADLSTDTKYGWRVTNSLVTVPGGVSVPSNIRDIVAMRIFPVTTKLIAPVGETDKTYVNHVVNLNNNFTVLIEEFQSQAYVGRDGRKFHFSLFPQIMNLVKVRDFPTTPASPYIEYTTSGKGNGWFWFKKPIVEFNTITISIGNPFDLVKLSNNERTLIPIQLIYLSEKTE